MSKSLVIARRILIALLSAFVAYRSGHYLAGKSPGQFELFDFMVAIPMFVMALVLFVVCIKALWRTMAT